MDQLLKNTGFRIHLIVYAAVNAVLMAINLLSHSYVLWFQWPLPRLGLGYFRARYSRVARREIGSPDFASAGDPRAKSYGSRRDPNGCTQSLGGSR